MNCALPALLGAVLVVATVPTLGAEYFLAPTGSDEAIGSRAAPWRTLARANAAVKPGDTVTLLDGKYPGVIEPAVAGQAGAPVTYRAATPLHAVLSGGKCSSGQLVCLRLKDREYVVVDGFAMLPDSGGWWLLEGARYCAIRNCRMENATGVWAPITCRNCHYNRYENLAVLRSTSLGADGHVCSNMWDNTTCTHNVFEGIHTSRAGHCPFMLWFDADHNVVRRSVFDCRWGRNFEFFSTPRLLVEDCVITNGFDGSGSADGRAKLFIIDSIFRRNAIYRNHYGPLVINAYKYENLPTFGMMRSRVYNNTWYANLEYGFEMVDVSAKPDPHMVCGNILQNNVFAGNDPGGDGVSLLLFSNVAEDNLFRANDLYGDRPGAKTVRYDFTWPTAERWPGVTLTATEANEKKPAQFTHNLDADPQFVDAAADDFRLRATSPCIDAGRPLALTTGAGSGREVAVDDARWFYDGFGIPGEQGDLVFIGAERKPARVARADIERNVLTLDREVSWGAGEAVTLPHLGRAPDLGAYEHGAEAEPWYRAPRIPPDLRVVTMQTATTPVVVTDFEPETLEQWHYLWNFSRQKNTEARIDATTAASGKRSMRVSATADGAVLACDIRPAGWELDRFPTVKLSYRIPPGVPVGLWLRAFRTTQWGQGAVCVGGTGARKTAPYKDLARYPLADDDRWHEVTIDARVIREVFPGVKLLQMFGFMTCGNGKQGQQFWYDDFRILPVGV